MFARVAPAAAASFDQLPLVTAVLVVFSAGAGAAQLLHSKDAAVAALTESVAGLNRLRESERAAADAKLAGLEAKLAGAKGEFEAKLVGAKGEFEAKLVGAGLSAENAALRVLKDYSVSAAGGEASKDHGAAAPAPAPPPHAAMPPGPGSVKG